MWVTIYLIYLRPIKDTFTTSWSQLSISTQTSAPWTTSSTGPWHTEETRTSTVPTAELLRSNLILREQNWRNILKHLGKRINTWRGEKKNMLLGLSATAQHRFIVCYRFFCINFSFFFVLSCWLSFEILLFHFFEGKMYSSTREWNVSFLSVCYFLSNLIRKF